MPFKDKEIAKKYFREYKRKRMLDTFFRKKVKCYHKRYALENPLKRAQYRKRWREKLKSDVFRHYGDSCSCCGEKEKKFLSVDHINGGGNRHRKKIGTMVYGWLRKENFPSGFQILCFNCNMAKGLYGSCPHLKSKQLTA